MDNVLDWFWEIPVVTRVYLAGALLMTALTSLDIVSPFALYFNGQLILRRHEYWRLLTTFLFFGPASIDVVFHLFFLVRYSRSLEDGSFRGRVADFVFFLLFGAAIMIAFAPFVNILFLGSSLTFMMVYVWGRRNPMQRMSFLGLFPFTAPYLPWVLLGFSMVLGSNAIMVDAIGIVAGHLYYYLEDVLPAIAESRGWRFKRVLHTPRLLHMLFGTHRQAVAVDNMELELPGLHDNDNDNDNDNDGNGNAPQPPIVAAADGGGGGAPVVDGGAPVVDGGGGNGAQ